MFLIVLDSFSKWIEVYPMKSITSSETIEKLKDCMARFGLPNTIVSDNGRQFTSNEFSTFCSKNGIKHLTSAPYNPQSNGAAENAVKSFKNGMFKALSDPTKKGNSTETLMNRYLFYYRSSVHATTLETPFNRMFGREMRTHFDHIKPSKLTSMCERVEQQHAAETKSNEKDRKFAINDNVMVRDYRSKSHPWQEATIKSTIGNRMYKCSTADGEWRRHANQIVPAKMVKPKLTINNDHFSSIDRFSIDNVTPSSNDVEPHVSSQRSNQPNVHDDSNHSETNSINQSMDQEYFTDEFENTLEPSNTSFIESANVGAQAIATNDVRSEHPDNINDNIDESSIATVTLRNIPTESPPTVISSNHDVVVTRSGRGSKAPNRLEYK